MVYVSRVGGAEGCDEILVNRSVVFDFWPLAGRNTLKKIFERIDWPIFFLALGFTVFGILMLYNASAATAAKEFNDKYFFLKDQIKWAILGISAALVISVLDYRLLFRWSPYFLLGSIALLILVFIPGLGVRSNGASRWINFRFFILQPAELTKLAFIIYLSAWFSTKDKSKMLSFLILCGVIVGLVLLQPDMGTAIILGFVGITMFFLAEQKVWQVLALALSFIPVGVLLAIKSPYRFARLTTFLNPDSDPLGASYHIRQALIALGSGGIFGLGLGNSRQKYSYLPEATTDSIFAIIGEELGLLGVTLFLVAVAVFVARGYRLALKITDDRFGQLLVAGVTSWLAVQTVVNLGSIVALMPLTGVPLPFISYGGSALVAQWIGIGIILSVSRQVKK